MLFIIRFCAVIKELEALSYLLLAIGLGFGAVESLITITAFIIIVGIVVLKSYFSKYEDNQNLYLTIISHIPEEIRL